MRAVNMRSWTVAVLGTVLLFGATACAPSGETESAPPSESSSTAPTEAPGDVTEDTDAEADVESVVGGCDDVEFIDAAAIPSQLSDLSVPFYPCAHEAVARTDTDQLLFVGEYDTNHELIIIEMNITAQFDASDWEITDRTVEGDNAITQAQKPGYSLVVAIGPSRTSSAENSIHYTLREQ